VADTPKVFISYSHDDIAHKMRVREFAKRLRNNGIDAKLDQDVISPEQGWPNWCKDNIKDADFVFIICTKLYYNIAGGREQDKEKKGVYYEWPIIHHLFYEREIRPLPIIFSDADSKYVPDELKRFTKFQPDDEDSFLELCHVVLQKQTGHHHVCSHQNIKKSNDKEIFKRDFYIDPPQNPVARCAELSATGTQGSTEAELDVLPELRFGVETIETPRWGEISYQVTKEAILQMELSNCSIIHGTRLGDEEHKHIRAQGNNEWIITGPREEGIFLRRRALGEDVICKINGAPTGSFSVVLRLKCKQRNIDATFPEEYKLDYNKKVVMRLFINKCIGHEGGNVILGHCKLGYKAKD